MADGVSIHFTGDFGKGVDELIARASAAGQRFVALGGLVILSHMMPATPVKTGTLRRSERVDNVIALGAGTWRSQTAPTTVYGRRIDIGFNGTDSLGRHYHQTGRFYVEASVRDSEDELGALHYRVMAEAVSG